MKLTLQLFDFFPIQNVKLRLKQLEKAALKIDFQRLKINVY